MKGPEQSLAHRRWIINVRGVATIVPSPGDIVYGLVYELTASDKRSLDTYEGSGYKILHFPIDLVPKDDPTNRHSVNSLIYIDTKRNIEGEPREEYIHRMNMAIIDALKEGIPADYIDKYLRRFIPEELDN